MRLNILVSIKSSFYARLLRKCDVIDIFFNHIYQNFLIVTISIVTLQRFTLPFCCKRFFNPNISETKQARLLKFFKDREANDLEINFPKNAKVLTLLICNSG